MPQEYIYPKKFQQGVNFEQEVQFNEPPHSLKDGTQPDHLVRLSQVEGMLGDGGASALSDLTDVELNDPSINQVLKFNGEKWYNAADQSGGSALQETGFKPKSVAGLVAHYDVSEMNSLSIPEVVSGPNLKVSQINDLSGNGFHLAQADPNLRPTLEFGTGPAASACLNFNGSQRIKYNDTVLPLEQPSTFFMVMKHGDWNGSGATIADFTNAHNTGLYYVTQGGKNQMVNAAGAYANGARYSYANMIGKWFVVSFKLNGGSSYLWVNDEPNPGLEEDWGANAGSNNPTQIWLGGWGGGEGAKFKMTEFLAYGENLSETDRKNIVNHLLAKYNIQTNKCLIAYGDSITKGALAVDVDENSFVAVAAAALGCQTYRFGFSGSTVYTMPNSIGLGEYYKNALITISYGTNEGSTSLYWKAFLKGMVQQLIARGYEPNQICLVTPPYRSDRIAYNNQILTYLNEIAAEIPGVRVANTLATMLAGGGDALLADGTHPTTAGHLIKGNTVAAAFA